MKLVCNSNGHVNKPVCGRVNALLLLVILTQKLQPSSSKGNPSNLVSLFEVCNLVLSLQVLQVKHYKTVQMCSEVN